MNLGKKDSGLIEPNNYIRCALYYPDNEVDQKIYKLYCYAGRSGDSNNKYFGRDPFAPVVSHAGHLAVMYKPELDVEWIPWELPEWSLDMARTIRMLANDAQSIGHETGYTNGLNRGKSFVIQLAKGEMAPNSYLDADDRDTRRLNRKEW